MAFPTGAVLWTLIGAGALVRTFYHPYRAVVANGYASRCAAGAGCDPSMVITSLEGASAVYACAPGTVVSASSGQVVLASALEPVVLVYGGVTPQVRAGQKVGAGEQIALGASVSFAVYRLDSSGPPVALEPATWLAARGLRVSQKRAAGSAWCDQGRHLAVPKQVASCGIAVPAPGAFMLLPVSSSTV